MGENPEREEAPLRAALGAAQTELLDGYDSIAGELRASPFDKKESPQYETGSETSARVAVCQGMTELTQALNIDQSLAIELGEMGKVDEKVKFARELKATSETLSIVVHARHLEKTKTTKNPKLIAKADPANVAAFVKAYGDSYVDSVSFGGEYYGVYTFHTQTSEEQKNLKMQLDGKGVRAGNSVELKTMVDLHDFATSSKTAWSFDQRLSGVKEELPTHEKMADFVRTFPNKKFDPGVVIDRSFARYENVPDFPLVDAYAPVIANRLYFRGVNDDGLARSLVRIAARTNKIDWIQKIHARYRFTGDTGLAAFKAQLKKDRDAIQAQLLQYAGNPLQKFTMPPLPSLDKPTPVLKYEKGSTDLGGWHGTNERFDYPNLEQALQSGLRLEALELRGSNYVDKITMVYRDARGGGDWETNIGGSGGGGTSQGRMWLDSNEFVKEVKSRRGEILDWIEITTTAGKQTHAGERGGADSPGFQATDGKVLLGFQGSGGVDVNTLEAVWVKLLDTT
jgi:hypothetical protein